MVVKEFENGMFQVWKEEEVLHPKKLIWHADYKSQHSFMFFPSLRKAKKAAKKVLAKEKILKTHDI